MKVLEKGHISDVALENYSLDHLPEPELEVVEEHILVCPTCQDRLQEIDDFVRAFRMAHQRLEASDKSDGTQIVGDGWFTEPATTVYAPNPAWYQQPAIWAGAAFAVLLLALVPTFLRRESVGAPNQAIASVELLAQRGAASLAEAPAGRVALQMDLRGVNSDPLSVEIATVDGRVVWQRTLGLAQAIEKVSPGIPLTTGLYWVRIHAAGDPALLREFGLKVR